MSNAIFVTATGTDVGKTFVTALLVKAYRKAGIDAGYYKAALSGAELIAGQIIPGDAAHVKRIAELPDPLDTLVSYVYREAVSPHLAARHEGNPVELKKVLGDFRAAMARHEFVFVEGSGGIVCPIRYDGNQKLFLIDIIRHLALDLLLIAPAGLGTINSTVLTVEYACQKDLRVRAIILNHYTDSPMERDNANMITQLTGIPVIARVVPNATSIDLNPSDLCTVSSKRT